MPKDGLLPQDPKGYWAVLGLSPGADTKAVKAAYRRRAKELHPDRNQTPRAREEFHLLSEAYRVLSDPARRRAYEDGDATPGGPTRTRRRRPSDPPSAAEAYARAAGTRKAGDSVQEPPASCCACGRIPAQPRYVILPTVQGRLWTSVQGTVEGIYCRRCADGAALAAALQTWVFGWWSLPFGPLHTVSALLTTLRGGLFPRDRNFRLLIRQAHAFLARQDRELARGVALQARAYADTEDERRLADALLAAARDHRPARALKNRWLGGSWLRTAQLGPPVAVATVLLAALGTWTNVNLWGVPGPERTTPPPTLAGLQRPLLLRTGQVYEVTLPRLTLRDGPDDGADPLAELDGGSMVLVTENAPRTGWVRVLTADGQSGFVAGRYLTPGLAPRGLDGEVVGRGVTDGGRLSDAMRDLLGGGITDGRVE